VKTINTISTFSKRQFERPPILTSVNTVELIMSRRWRNRPKAESFDTDIMRVLNLIPMMDILTVLVIFLLITAVLRILPS